MWSKIRTALLWIVGLAGVAWAVVSKLKLLKAAPSVPTMPKVSDETLKQVAEAEAQAKVVREQAAVEVKNEVEEIKKIADGKLGSERRKRLAALAKKD